MNAPPTPAWRQHAVAAFIAWHLLSVLVFIIPYPPALDDRTLALPEVRTEMDRFFSSVHRVAPLGADQAATQARVVGWLRAYTDAYMKVRRPFEAYLQAVAGTQSWNMFGGTPPREPKVLVVGIEPAGAAEVVFADHHWGTPAHHRANFRDFKAHEVLGLPGWDRQRSDYARWWARRWDREHPEAPASTVHLYYVQMTTPSPERVRAGDTDRRERAVQHFHWRVPRESP